MLWDINHFKSTTAMRNIYLYITILCFFTQSAFSQKADEYGQIISGQVNTLVGKTLKWDVKQDTYFSELDLQARKKAINDRISQLDPNDPHYSSVRSLLEGDLKDLASINGKVQENIAVEAQILDLNKWRITVWPKQIEEKNKTIFLADGSGHAYCIKEGMKKIIVYKNSNQALAEALRGIPIVQLYSLLPGVEPAVFSKQVTSKNDEIAFKDKLGRNITGSFDRSSLLCTKFSVLTESGSPIISVKKADESSFLSEQFLAGTKQYVQTMLWKQTEANKINSIDESDFKMQFTSGYKVWIPNKNSGFKVLDSDVFIGKTIDFE